LAADDVTASGDVSVFETLASIFDTFNASFNLATP
jgi:hypothetical protein